MNARVKNKNQGVDRPVPTERQALLGGLSAQQFMRRHWQKKPLLVRQAVPGVQPPVSWSELLRWAQNDEVSARLVTRRAASGGPAGQASAPLVARSATHSATRSAARSAPLSAGQAATPPWSLLQAPLTRKALAALKQPLSTLLVQGVDTRSAAAHALLQRFRFIPDARLDDLMVSCASQGGGVGPHLDSYDVFLLQVQGRRRWRIGTVDDDSLVPGVPLKILRRFKAQQTWVLEPGDMLYLPPRWGHDGVAVDDGCMTCSIGFRAPRQNELAAELLSRLAQDIDGLEGPLYRDAAQTAVAQPGSVPPALQTFAAQAVARALKDPHALQRVLGEWLTEPKASLWFDAPAGPALLPGQGVRLDRKTRMQYDQRHVYINGESFEASGRDARLMAQLADTRCLAAADVKRLTPGANRLLADWVDASWMEALDDEPDMDT